MSCAAEASGDDHSHSHGHSHDHDHDDDAERGMEFSLFQQVDNNGVRCLNAVDEAQGARLFRPFSERADKTHYVESDADEQLLIFIPFTADIKLKSIMIVGEADGTHPRTMKAWKNVDHLDFDDVEERTPVQSWDLHADPTGALEYNTRISQFQGVHSLTLFFPNNYGSDTTRIHFIGLKGEFKQLKRDTIITVYEASANPADHKNKATDHSQVSRSIQ